MVYLWSLQTVYVVNDEEVPRNRREKKKDLTRVQTLMSSGCYQYNNWVGMYSMVVILREEKQETRVLYFFSYDMSSFVIQVLRTVSHSKQKLPKNSFLFFFPSRGREEREENLLDAHKHCLHTGSSLIAKGFKRTMVEFVASHMHLLTYK